MGRLDGKVCVITGAGGGMGRDATLLFTEEGAEVCAAEAFEVVARDARRGNQPSDRNRLFARARVLVVEAVRRVDCHADRRAGDDHSR